MFTGREYDVETGLYYYRERYYSSHIGRFLQTDPLGIYDENTYTYCYNAPVNWIDPYGLETLVIPALFSGTSTWLTVDIGGIPGTSNWPVIDLGGLEAKDEGKPGSLTEHYFKNAAGKKERREDKDEKGKKPDREIRPDKPPSRPHYDKKTDKYENEHWHYRDYNWDPNSGKWRPGKWRYGGPGSGPNG